MKVESTDQNPKFNLMQPDGVRSQAHNQEITHVLLTDERWYKILPGSFKFYKTAQNPQNPGVPFVQFDTVLPENEAGGVFRVEVFPATVAGIGYPKPEGA